MSSPEKRKELSAYIWKEIIPLCSNGNKDAESYLKQFFFIIRMIDDLKDRDYPVEGDNIIRGFFYLMAEIPHNKFYKAYADSLTSIHIIGFNAWQNANEWQNSNNETKRIYAHVLRDYICELFALVAFHTGGEELMKKVSLKVREVFLKEINSISWCSVLRAH